MIQEIFPKKPELTPTIYPFKFLINSNRKGQLKVVSPIPHAVRSQFQ